MKRRMIPFLLVLCLLAGCGGGSSGKTDGQLTVLATTYPIYLFASSITQSVEGVTVERLDTGSVSCLHDYTLSVQDMKKIEQADLIAMNGVGLEEFMDDALAGSGAAVADCSKGVELLFTLEHDHEGGHEDHDHDHGDYDPHYWMDPNNARIMVENLRSALSELDPEHAREYQEQASQLDGDLVSLDLYLRQDVLGAQLLDQGKTVPGLITFHDGFQYFAHAYGLPLLSAIEEEAGSEASAKEILEITQLVEEYHIPVIFTEFNGSDATANAIARETGCQVAQLTMMMDQPETPLEDIFGNDYLDGMAHNMWTIVRTFAGEEAAK